LKDSIVLSAIDADRQVRWWLLLLLLLLLWLIIIRPPRTIVPEGLMFLACYVLSPVRPSVRHTGISYKMVEVRIMKFLQYGSPMPIFAGVSFIQKL